MSLPPEEWVRVKRVFDAAVALDAAARPAYLARACADDAALRQRVETMLASHDRAPAFLETPAAVLLPTPDDLIGRTIGPYRIVERIGAGGMAEVYKAEDSKLDRPVALKLLPAHLSTDPDRLRRFHAEARAASSLNHPHIVVVHDFGEIDGRPFIVTEFVEGQTVRQRLDVGPIAAPEALDIATQIASALTAAHARGLVHRDIKPENVMQRPDGYVKVLDFGLAKLTAPVGAPRAAHTLAVMGTPRYMSPEQVRGSDVDERSDIWSLGVLLYEMLAGRPPFDGSTSSDVMATVLRAEPPPLEIASTAPPLRDIVFKALAKDSADRFDSAFALHRALAAQQTALSGATAAAARSRRGVATRVAWALAATVALAGAVTAARLLIDSRAAAPARPVSGGSAAATAKNRLVVLPFENLTRAAADDWLAGGLSDSLTYGLQNLDTLTLATRERVAELYRQQHVPDAGPVDPKVLRTVVESLQVRYYVQGNFQRVGDQIRIVARLVEVNTGEVRAQETITDRFDRLLDLEDQLASRFAAALAGQLPAGVHTAGTVSLEASRALTEARTLYAAGRFAAAETQLARALAIDPQYAQAWALLSKAQSRAGASGQATGETQQPIRDAAVQSATRAIAIDPSLYDARVALALANRFNGLTEAWRQAAGQAIALNPRDAEAYVVMADSYSMSTPGGCSRDRDGTRAEDYYQTALRLDPAFPVAHTNRIANLMWANRPQEALAATLAAVAAAPAWSNLRVHEILLKVDQEEPVDPAAIDALNVDTIGGAFAHAWVDLQRRSATAAWQEFDRADALLAKSPAPEIDIYAGFVYLRAGRPSRAIANFQRAVKMDPACGRYIAAVPLLSRFSRVPEFASFIQGLK